ncbi:polymer-forming cytoskeletal protein [Paenibacillus sp. 1011MAR3C5]|uniref:bactofilin family protein n=1 Tax=Paenibacillus sp. 1011MAR3C5 TaxID=1675787 RepID=UPI000E6B5969|nr:polymer-forming cytoskeletal protein [Paenibacillus sp. 1011MAR3C5]RJE87572.1 polymer-forming cytoskeletal protein [Paenibacillus sp. 1011MAR3C5]
MFKSSKSGSGKINPDTTDTLIGEGTIFEGKIKSEASIRIEGSIIGDIISSGDVIVGENGVANSNITARDLVLAGQLNGDVEARGKLTICATGILNGNITAQSLIIESGGVFNGSSKMAASPATAAQSQKELKATS